MSPLQGFECVWRTYSWARAHGYIVPPRSGLNRKNEVETQKRGLVSFATRRLTNSGLQERRVPHPEWRCKKISGGKLAPPPDLRQNGVPHPEWGARRRSTRRFSFSATA